MNIILCIKIAFRNILRHPRNTIRLVVTLCLSSLLLIFLLAFKNSFNQELITQYTDTISSHIQLIPPGSTYSKTRTNKMLSPSSDPVFSVPPGLLEHLSEIATVQYASPMYFSWVHSYNIDGEREDYFPILAIDIDTCQKIFPQLILTAGKFPEKSILLDGNLPIARPNPRNRYTKAEPFNQSDLISINEIKLNTFLNILQDEFPWAFPPNSSLASNNKLENIIDALNIIISTSDFISLLPSHKTSWQLEDALYEYEQEKDETLKPFYCKRIIQAVYPDYIAAIDEPVYIGKLASVFLQIPNTDNSPSDYIVPVIYSGFIQGHPLYPMGNPAIIDLELLKDYLALKENIASSIVIRLHDESTIDKTIFEIEAYLKSNQYNLEVVSQKEMASEMNAITVAVDIIIIIFILLIAFISACLGISLILQTLAARKQEIGASLANGDSIANSIMQILIENNIILLFSWALGSVLVALIFYSLQSSGIQGLYFFTNGILHLHPKNINYIQSLLILFLSIQIATLPFIFTFYKQPILHLLKEGFK